MYAVKHVFCFIKNSLNAGYISENDNGHQKVIASHRHCYLNLYTDNYRPRSNRIRFFQYKTDIFNSIIPVVISNLTYD